MDRAIELRGITWDHRRAVDPLLATLPGFRAAHPLIDVAWTSRSLHGFEFEPVARLADAFDLVVLDHPFCGDIAASGCLLPLERHLDLTDGDFIGPSLDTYRYAGSIWALPIDAATQVAVARPDLMARLDAAVPRSWAEVLALGARARAREMSLAIGLEGVHSLMTFFSLCASLGRPCRTEPGGELIDGITARTALDALRALVALCPADCLDWSSILLHDRMVARDDLVFCPAVYAYATYAEADQRRPLRFHDFPGLDDHGPRGSTIGGTGLGVSARCLEPEAALAYLRHLATPAVQRAFALHHGQPAHAAVWRDPAIDARFGGCFAATRATMAASWIRPRYPGYLRFQAEAGPLIEQHLRGSVAEADLLLRLQRLHESCSVR